MKPWGLGSRGSQEAQYLDLPMRNSFQAPPTNPSLSQWHHEIMTSGSTSDHCEFKVEQWCWWSAAVRQKSISCIHTFLMSQKNMFLFLTILLLSAWLSSCLVSKQTSHQLFLSLSWRKNTEPQLTPSHNIEEESFFWHIKHFQEMEWNYLKIIAAKGISCAP